MALDEARERRVIGLVLRRRPWRDEFAAVAIEDWLTRLRFGWILGWS
jgi:hypothetical protein